MWLPPHLHRPAPTSPAVRACCCSYISSMAALAHTHLNVTARHPPHRPPRLLVPMQAASSHPSQLFSCSCTTPNPAAPSIPPHLQTPPGTCPGTLWRCGLCAPAAPAPWGRLTAQTPAHRVTPGCEHESPVPVLLLECNGASTLLLQRCQSPPPAITSSSNTIS